MESPATTPRTIGEVKLKQIRKGNAKIWARARRLQHHESLPHGPSRCPHSRDCRSAPTGRHPPPGAAVPTIRSCRSEIQKANQTRLPLENELHARSRPAPLPHGRTSGTCTPRHQPSKTHRFQPIPNLCGPERPTPRTQLGGQIPRQQTDPLVRSGRGPTQVRSGGIRPTSRLGQ
jgi:hypothetical protein